MRLLVTGICGFVGSTLAKSLITQPWVSRITGIDNFSRAGSETNRRPLADLGIRVIAGDIRSASDTEALEQADWVIDAAANPSVLAGVDGKTSSRQLVEHNLLGTINLLEYCKRHSAGFILLSTSRVYSIAGLASLPVKVVNDRFELDMDAPSPPALRGRGQGEGGKRLPPGISATGVSEAYSTQPPVSLYGSTKVASEHLALEYGSTFDFPVWINRCGVMAGAGQFGHPAQGIFAYWVHSFREGKPLKYIGFGGQGYQVRDCLHPRDLVPLLKNQTTVPPTRNSPLAARISNFSGGATSAMSLAQLTAWCTTRYPNSPTVASLPTANCQLPTTAESSRPFDIPWMVLDSTSAQSTWNWNPQITTDQILREIASHADENPDWLAISSN